MEFIRFFHPKHYDKHRNEFKSLAFKTIRNGGASILWVECIKSSGLTICEHASKFYESAITGDPPVFWRFDSSSLPATLEIQQTDGGNNDPCHHDIFWQPDRLKHRNADDALREIVKNIDIMTLERCRNGQPELISEVDLLDFARVADG